MRHLLTLVLTTVAFHHAIADAFLLQNNSVISGTLIRETAGELVVERFGQPITYSRSTVREFFRDSSAVNVTNLQIPRLEHVLTSLVKQPWATEIRQIPATVITTGSLRNLPYISFRCGIDYEVNVYGDPQSPACVEVGMYRSLLTNESAKTNCLSLMTALMSESHADKILGLSRNGETKSVSNVVFEVTSPTASDSFGGWWIAVYEADKLDSSRASAIEMKDITAKREGDGAKPNTDSGWIPEELRRARNYPVVSAEPRTTGGAVYVRGYHRKDGTYVQPHTRRKSR
jgi:hypothetical protein